MSQCGVERRDLGWITFRHFVANGINDDEAVAGWLAKRSARSILRKLTSVDDSMMASVRPSVAMRIRPGESAP